jgi:hypothetical protein
MTARKLTRLIRTLEGSGSSVGFIFEFRIHLATLTASQDYAASNGRIVRIINRKGLGRKRR